MRTNGHFLAQFGCNFVLVTFIASCVALHIALRPLSRLKKTISYLIYQYVREKCSVRCSTRTLNSVLNKLPNDDVQDFDLRWDRAPSTGSEMPSDCTSQY